jgi:hypothetical protein
MDPVVNRGIKERMEEPMKQIKYGIITSVLGLVFITGWLVLGCELAAPEPVDYFLFPASTTPTSTTDTSTSGDPTITGTSTTSTTGTSITTTTSTTESTSSTDTSSGWTDLLVDLTSLSATASDDGQTIILSWDLPKSTAVTDVEIRMSTSTYPTETSGVRVALIGVDETPNNYYIQHAMNPDSSYYYTVFTKDAAGNFSTGIQKRVFTRDTKPPELPTNFTPFDAAYQNIYISFDLPDDPDYGGVYYIFRPDRFAEDREDTYPHGAFVQDWRNRYGSVSVDDAPNNLLSIAGVIRNYYSSSSLYVTVWAYDLAADGFLPSYSEPIYVRADLRADPINNLTVYEGYKRNVLSWANPDNENWLQGIDILVSTDGPVTGINDPNAELVQRYTTSEPGYYSTTREKNFIHDGLTPDTTYYYGVFPYYYSTQDRDLYDSRNYAEETYISGTPYGDPDAPLFKDGFEATAIGTSGTDFWTTEDCDTTAPVLYWSVLADPVWSHSGYNCAYTRQDNANFFYRGYEQEGILWASSKFDLTGKSEAFITYYALVDLSGVNNIFQVEVGTGDYACGSHATNRYYTSDTHDSAYRPYVIDLTPYCGNSDVNIRFVYISDYAGDSDGGSDHPSGLSHKEGVWLDDIQLDAR